MSAISRIAILGVGLIGSSIARAAKAQGCSVALYDADADVRARAASFGMGVVFDTAPEAVAEAELIIIAAPVGAMAAAAASAAPAMAAGVIVSDVGSVKRAVRDAVAPVLPAGVHFIPGHPIAGTEQSGPEAGFAALFSNRWTILTPRDDPAPDYQAAVGRLAAFWTQLGARVEIMDADRHDLVLAVTSHLPHLIAFNIVAMAEDYEKVTDSEAVKFSAGGFRDFTRIAASDPTMWRDVFLHNREAVLEILGRFTEDLFALQRAIRWGDGERLFEIFARARRMRREVIEAGQDSPAPNWGRDQGG